jgi:hypothetical protein
MHFKIINFFRFIVTKQEYSRTLLWPETRSAMIQNILSDTDPGPDPEPDVNLNKNHSKMSNVTIFTIYFTIKLSFFLLKILL